MSHENASSWKQTIIAAMTSYIDAGSIVAGAAGLSLWQAYLGMDGLQLGLLASLSSNAASAAVGALIGGRLCDAYGRKFVYTYDLLVYIVGMLLIVFAFNFPMLLIGYIIVGLGVGADVVASWTLIAEQAPAKDRAKHCGSAQFAWALGPAIVLLMSAYLNTFGLIGNRIVFAHLILVAAWVWYQRLKMPESNDWKKAHEEEKRLVAEGKIKKLSYGELLSNAINLKTVIFLICVYSVWNLCASTWGFFMPYIFENVAKLSNTMSQVMSVGSFVLSIFGTYFIFMKFGDRISRRLIYFVIGGIYVIAWSVWILPPESLASWMLFMFVIFAGINNGSGQQAFYQLWCSELFPTKYRATAQGLTFFITRIICSVWVFCAPLIMESLGFRYAAMLITCFALISWLVGSIWAPKTQGKTLREIEIERYGEEVH
ncbi:MAG: MFS transporter [Candidatus Anaerobiospirillum pullicola]|uniref:MFS transporter n=1 Tax=Candidatus Anaerobiospirillum pullicola TaxID=2838451 RepID=A0A948TEN0_9GAMM|nr:MFS transporter [Candidatus Anaerobiospirillum pullicola]